MKAGYTQTIRNTSGDVMGRKMYVPRMSDDGAEVMSAVYRSVGVEAEPSPESDDRTLELAKQYIIGEECYPQIVVLGGFLKILEQPDFDPEKTAFMMPTACGPCRFGQYKPLFEKILKEKNVKGIALVSPNSGDGYRGFGEHGPILVRLGWWAILCADGLRKLLLQTRPYEINPGDTDRVHRVCLDNICAILEKPGRPLPEKMDELAAAMEIAVDSFSKVEADYHRNKPLIGVLGEIYCRLDDFTNAQLIRRVEKFGGEVWLASISEWIWFTLFIQKQELRICGETFSKAMAGSMIRGHIQAKDEERLFKSMQKRIIGYEDPHSIGEMVKPARPYLPHTGAYGEMVMNIGGLMYLHKKGADGIIDISPFTCMNGIVCEAVYPRVSRDHDHMPIRIFYFDGTQSDLDRDVEIFVELADTYRRRKTTKRVYPAHFS